MIKKIFLVLLLMNWFSMLCFSNSSTSLQTFRFLIVRSIDFGYSVELLEILETEKGVIKENRVEVEEMNYRDYYVGIAFLNNENEFIDSCIILNPLIQWSKVSDENGKKSKQKVELFEATFSITVEKIDDYSNFTAYIFTNNGPPIFIGGRELNIAVGEDPCLHDNTGYIVCINRTKGIEAESMKLYINGKYCGEIAPGEESPKITLPAGQTYEVKGQTQSGAVQIKDIELGQCEEVGVRLLQGSD